jgi:ketosteroid isomerase-like protein
MENEILTAFGKLIDALTQRRDAAAAIALFADDEDVTFWGSREDDIAVGPVAVANMVRGITAANHQVHTSFPQRRVSIVGDVGWVNAVGEVRAPASGPPLRTAPYRITGIFVCRDGAWRCHTFSGSEPHAPSI